SLFVVTICAASYNRKFDQKPVLPQRPASSQKTGSGQRSAFSQKSGQKTDVRQKASRGSQGSQKELSLDEKRAMVKQLMIQVQEKRVNKLTDTQKFKMEQLLKAQVE